MQVAPRSHSAPLRHGLEARRPPRAGALRGLLTYGAGPSDCTASRCRPHLSAVLAAAWLAALQPPRRRRRRRQRAAASGRRGAASPDPTPSAFRVVELPGRGLGAVASREVGPGELLASEKPLLTFPAGGGWRDAVRRQLERLPDLRREEVLALLDAEAAPGRPASLEGIVRTNSFSVEEDSTGGVVCDVLSRFNHSCCPNCEASWCANSGVQQIYASTTISAGEELCIYYTDVRAPREERRQELQKRYLFSCNCPACREADSSSDLRRSEMQRLEWEIGRVSARDPARGMALSLELLDLYDAEGLHPQNFRKRACYYMFQLSLLVGNLTDALHWGQRAHNYSTQCHGPQHKDTRLLLQYLEAPEDHPAWKARTG